MQRKKNFPMPFEKAPLRSESLTEKAMHEIRRRIVEGDLALGEALSEAALAAELQTSKTPVREALVQLKREGLVQVYPQRGTFVFEVDRNSVSEICEFRQVLEVAAFKRAATRHWGQLVDALEKQVALMKIAVEGGDLQKYRYLDASFHNAFFEYCDNSYLREAYALVSFRVQALRTRLSTFQDKNRATASEHEEIVQRLINRRIDDATHLLCEHIRKTEVSYLSLIK